MRRLFLGTIAAATMSFSAAHAASVTITLTEFDNRAQAVAAQQALLSGHTLLGYEDFEDFTSFDGCRDDDNCDAGDVSNYDFASAETPLLTDVGTFTPILPEGTGGSNRAPDDAAIIRSNADENNNGQPNFGRYDADLSGTRLANFIDSNDNSGIALDTSTSGLGMFNWISFILTDFDDVGEALFAVNAAGSDVTGDPFVNTVEQGNGDIFLATLFFSDFVEDVTVSMNIDPGDGFGADSFAVSVVPLPAAAWFLIAGLGALGAVARRKPV